MFLSVIGSIAVATPVAAGVVLNTDNVTNGALFVITIFVGLSSIGVGVGKLYARWKQQIASSIHRDELLSDLCDRVARIEERQMSLIERFDRLGK